MTKLKKKIVASLMVGLLLVGGIGFQFVNNNSQPEEETIIVTEERIPLQDPDPVKS